MKTLVVDVAAEHGGALTILRQHIDEFKADTSNNYLVLLSRPRFEESDNVKFINVPWVKKSWLHRLYFDHIYIKKIVSEYSPDEIFSLQNKTVASEGIRQKVYYHNILPLAEKRFSFFEAPKFWIYQNLIGRIFRYSLKKASLIYVQADWIKEKMADEWGVDRRIIKVKRPKELFFEDKKRSHQDNGSNISLFYPASGAIYKNHLMLLQALKEIWEDDSLHNKPKLLLTGKLGNLSKDCQLIVNSGKYPIEFLGRLNQEQMYMRYLESTLVFPSYMETIALPLIEARSVGIRILAADCLYSRESLGEYDKAVFFDPFDHKSIKKAIIDNCRLS